MKDFTYNRIKFIRKTILNNNKHVDSLFIEGTNNVLISVPHGVAQTRLGKHKVAEIGTVSTGKILADETNCNILIKTKNNFDDANFDRNCEYRKKLKQIIKKHNIKYLIDLHGLAKWRDCDVNLGTNLGNNIENDIELFNRLNNMLCENFNVKIDVPFMASGNTISACVKRDFNIWTLQIEINCSITNHKENINKYNLLLQCLSTWIKSIN